MVIGVKDQTGCHNLIRRKDVNLALAQFAFIFQKHEFLILKDFILKWIWNYKISQALWWIVSLLF